jgi:uncharacterized protein (TIGR02266 family)
MTEERRKARRARIPGMRVVFEDAAGERVEADVLDVGSGGLFLRTAKPLAPGKRMSLEVQAFAGVAAWSALGRVVWTRDTGTKDAAPGMAVKLIDVDDAVVAAIDRLVEARDRTQPRTGAGEAPAREPTVLGLGTPENPPVAASPIVPVAAARERTVLGVGSAGAPAAAKAQVRERSVQEPPPEDWDLPDPHEVPTRENVVPQRVVPVVREEASPPKLAPEPEPRTPLPEASIAIDLVARKPEADVDDAPLPSVPRRRGGRWLLFLLLVVAAAAAALYVMRGRIPWVQRLVETWTASPPPPAPAPVAPPPSAPTAAPTPSPAASPTASGAASARPTPSAAPSTSPSASKAALRGSPAASPAAAPTKRPAGDNPY